MRLGIPTRDPSPSSDAGFLTELTATVVYLEARNSELTEALAARDESLAARDARIADLVKLLENSRCSGKRQAAPFSKGDPTEEPARPGRRSGKSHGRHGHRAAPGRTGRPGRTGARSPFAVVVSGLLW